MEKSSKNLKQAEIAAAAEESSSSAIDVKANVVNPLDTLKPGHGSKAILLYWAIASFIGRCELFALADDLVACAEEMRFKICPPDLFEEYIDDSFLSPDERVKKMCDRIVTKVSPDFVLCVLNGNLDIQESCEKQLNKCGIYTQCVLLPDTNRWKFLQHILLKIHSEYRDQK